MPQINVIIRLFRFNEPERIREWQLLLASGIYTSPYWHNPHRRERSVLGRDDS
ncbi:MAG: hypothetical protein AAF639_25320 [Chloroflexota bacterium]